MKDEIKIFAYGTLQPQFRLFHRIIQRTSTPIEIVAKKVVLAGYGLAVSEQQSYPICYPNPQGRIKGTIIGVNTKQFHLIMDAESDYFMKVISVETENEWHRCILFYDHKQDQKVIKSGNFLFHARKHKLPSLWKK